LPGCARVRRGVVLRRAGNSVSSSCLRAQLSCHRDRLGCDSLVSVGFR
jgi:hypothetical protein